MSKNKAYIAAVFGATGSGKSSWIKRQMAKEQRRLIWDPMAEYGDHGEVVESLEDLVSRLAAKAKEQAFVYRPSTDPKKRAIQFDMFCRIALAAGNLLLVAEELRFVTTPSRAPVGWAQVCLTGRHKGLKVIGASQRPASVDKDFLGNATMIRSGRLVYPEDIRAVCKATGLAESEFSGMENLQWIEKDMTTGRITRGRLTF